MGSWLGPPPAIKTTPKMIRPTMVTTLMDENQNSASPYARAPQKLTNHTSTINAEMYTAAFVWGSQYEMTIELAVSLSSDRFHRGDLRSNQLGR